MKEALFTEKAPEGKVHCLLCPHQCLVVPGRTGICGVRKNVGGTLYSLNYGVISSIHSDPVEKKPLYHFHPGSMILSIGSLGCNLQCLFCQNHEISQVSPEEVESMPVSSPEEIVSAALNIPGNLGIAYTYNEPVVSFEMVLETARLAKEKGLKNVMVTNGYIRPRPLETLLPYIDAFNIDLKGFTEEFYLRLTHSRLAPVKESIRTVRRSGKHLELTNLIIPGHNDDDAGFRKMTEWIAFELGQDTVFHISRYFPRHKLSLPPTPEKTLTHLYEIARTSLNYVYLGNTYASYGQDTHCPSCHNIVISRSGYSIHASGIDSSGKCKFCLHQIL